MQRGERLLIFGASARAAAFSALRAGLSPWCADLFADTDLRALAPDSVRCPADRYPGGFADILRTAPVAPWMYTGGLENHPTLVRRLADLRPLWGNGPDALARSRCPFTVHRLLRAAGLPPPEVRAVGSDTSSPYRWLRKPVAGSAGQGISFADVSGRPGPAASGRRTHYEQQFIDGPPMSAVFVRGPGETRLLGITRQLVGEPWLNAPAFRYAGNIGPIRLPTAAEDEVRHVGRILGDGCGLGGLFGVDFIWHGGHAWVVEVNPRYPASVEVIERATGQAVLSLHAAAFEPQPMPSARPEAWATVVGKAILYAPRRLVMPPHDVPGSGGIHQRSLQAPRSSALNGCGDVPAAGEVINEGWPILTIFAESEDEAGCQRALQARTKQVSELLIGKTDSNVR